MYCVHGVDDVLYLEVCARVWCNMLCLQCTTISSLYILFRSSSERAAQERKKTAPNSKLQGQIEEKEDDGKREGKKINRMTSCVCLVCVYEMIFILQCQCVLFALSQRAVLI